MSRAKSAISTIAVVVIIVILVVAAAGGIYYFSSKTSTSLNTSTSSQSATQSTTSSTSSSPSSSSSTQTTSSSQSSTLSSSISASTTSSSSTSSTTSSSTSTAPSSLTYETSLTYQYLDPGVSYGGLDWATDSNVYESLLGYNGSCGSCVIPWLAQNYTSSADLKTYNFTLRSGINFADGEALNSTAVYFSLNRLLVMDGSTPITHGTQASWLIQEMMNTSLSSNLCCAQTYNATYVQEVLAQNFVQITGPLTFQIHVLTPTAAFPYLLSIVNAEIIAPNYVMQQDLALWNQSTTGYTLPYPKLSGNLSSQIQQYFLDEVSTCNSGATPKGCAVTYLENSKAGSLATTGPYTIQSVNPTTDNIVLQSNAGYWGGPSGSVHPQIKVININYVPSVTTRELDLQSLSGFGHAISIDLPNTNFYDVVNRNAWLNNHTLESVLSGVTVYGPYAQYGTGFDAFGTNVTNSLTGQFYTFQPFADRRIRLAFADSVNVSQIVDQVGNGIWKTGYNVVPPGLPPVGSYNTSIAPVYSFNPDESAQLLLQAMQSPLTSFNFVNGTTAPSGVFNNSFGCPSLDAQGVCAHPISQSITLTYDQGFQEADATIMEEIASAINNISSTYNMGLTVSVAPAALGFFYTQLAQGYLYMFNDAWGADYPWVTDFLNPFFTPSGFYSSGAHWNIPYLSQLYRQAAAATADGNLSGVIKASNLMNIYANQNVMYIWSENSADYYVMSSNVHGYFFNPSDYFGLYEPYWAGLS